MPKFCDDAWCVSVFRFFCGAVGVGYLGLPFGGLDYELVERVFLVAVGLLVSWLGGLSLLPMCRH